MSQLYFHISVTPYSYGRQSDIHLCLHILHFSAQILVDSFLSP